MQKSFKLLYTINVFLIVDLHRNIYRIVVTIHSVAVCGLNGDSVSLLMHVVDVAGMAWLLNSLRWTYVIGVLETPLWDQAADA